MTNTTPLESPTAEAAEPNPLSVPWLGRDALLVGLVWLTLLFTIGGSLIGALQRAFPNIAENAWALIVTQVLLAATVTGFVQLRHPGAVGRLFGPRRPSPVDVGIGIGAGVVAVLMLIYPVSYLVTIVTELLRTSVPEVQEEFRDLAASNSGAPLLLFGAGFIGPVAEEIFYRGLFFAGLRRRFRKWPAMLLSAVFFAVSHVQTDVAGYVYVVAMIIPLGMFLAWLYERRGTLLAPILAHAMFNLVQVLILIGNDGQV